MSAFDEYDDGEEAVSLGRCRLVKETARAILLFRLDESDEVWVPKSVVHPDSDAWDEGTDEEIMVYGWFARKEGLA